MKWLIFIPKILFFSFVHHLKFYFHPCTITTTMVAGQPFDCFVGDQITHIGHIGGSTTPKQSKGWLTAQVMVVMGDS